MWRNSDWVQRHGPWPRCSGLTCFGGFRPLWVSEHQPQLLYLDLPGHVPPLDCTQTLGHASRICLLLQTVLSGLREMTSCLVIIFSTPWYWGQLSSPLPNCLTQQGASSFLPQVHWFPQGAPRHHGLQSASWELMFIGMPGQVCKADVSSD